MAHSTTPAVGREDASRACAHARIKTIRKEGPPCS